MIKTIIKEHPLRDIVLDFDDAIEAPEFEKRKLALYYEAHDKTWTLKQHAEQQIKSLQEADGMIQELSIRRLGIEQDLDFMEEGLGLKAYDENLKIDSEIIIDIGTFFESGIRHNKDLQRLYTIIHKLTLTFNEDVGNIYEDDFLIDPMYFSMLSELYQRYDDISVHTVSLDEDHQNFLGAYGEVHDLFFQYIDLAEEIFDQYAQLVQVSEKLYRRMEIVQDRLDDKISGRED